MISDVAREALNMSVVPILLGDGFCARVLAVKVFFKYGIQSIICDERQSAWRFLFCFGGFYKIIRSSEARLLCEELERIATLSSGGLLILAPCDCEMSALVGDSICEMEKRFVIATADTLLDKIYPDEQL